MPVPGNLLHSDIETSLVNNIQVKKMLKVLVTQLCPTLCNPMDCSLPGSSVHGILQARILERVAISFSRGSSDPGTESGSPALQADSLWSEPPGKTAQAKLWFFQWSCIDVRAGP